MLNKFAQEKINFEQIINWFDSSEVPIQRTIINWLNYYLIQSHPDKETLHSAIQLIPLKPTSTPIILLKKHNLKIALDKIELLPEYETKKSFISLISIFKITDTQRRNTTCKNGCSHNWHNLENYN